MQDTVTTSSEKPASLAAAAARTGKELIDATKPFTKEDSARSWLLLAITLFVYGSFTYTSLRAPWLPLRIFGGICAGLTIVRLFIFYHDYLHLAIFRKSTLAKVILYIYGTLVLTPPQAWRDSHNYHHANNAKIVGSHVGSYAMVTVGMWKKMSAKERFMYSAIRHPLNILMGYFTIFMLGLCVSPFLRQPKKNIGSAIALLVNWSLTAFLIWKFGVGTWFFGMFLPLATATATGSYLFYVQHNFDEIVVQPRHEWSYTKAALESSSYLKTGPIMRWFTGNIGLHHVHHLNPMIPFYRLPAAMAAIPELQSPATVTLSVKDIIGGFRLKVWDPDKHRMVGYPENDRDTELAHAAE